MSRTFPALLITAVTLGLVGCVSGVPPKTQAESLVERARWTIQSFKQNSEEPAEVFRTQLKTARGVLIVPGSFKGAFVVGAEGGNAVLLARDASGQWSSPAFYSLGKGSFGLQAGAQSSQIVLLLRTDRAVQAVLNDQGTLGADMGITVGTLGGGLEGATTTNLGADVVGVSDSAGAFAGVSLAGGMLIRRNDLNEAYYGPGATPQAIVVQHRFSNPQAEPLRQALVM